MYAVLFSMGRLPLRKMSTRSVNDSTWAIQLFMKHKKKHPWFKPKAYTHFNPKINFDKLGFVESYVSKPENIIKHRFLPLIHKTVPTKRLRKIEGSAKKRFYKIVDGIKESNTKYRELYYASHLDAHIYSYYTNYILSPIYESKLKSIPFLSDCIAAYRKVEIAEENRGKCNIDFANEIFVEIKKRQGDIVVIAFDIKKFFDSLNHSRLKKAWYLLLSTENKSLPPDHYQVYKSLINFSFVDFYALINSADIAHPNDIVEKDIQSFLRKGQKFTEIVGEKKIVRKNPFRNNVDENSQLKEKVGIPQGTPMSAFLANLYMFEFDKIVFEEVVTNRKGMYRRYSDDILIIVNKEDEAEVERFVMETIADQKLIIQPEKTQKTYFNTGKLFKGCKPLQYLGFDFDGRKVLIKSSSLAKFYIKLKKGVRREAFLTKMQNARDNKNNPMQTNRLLKRYSHFGAKSIKKKNQNFFTYVNKAQKIIGGKAIKSQLSKAMGILTKEMIKRRPVPRLAKRDE